MSILKELESDRKNTLKEINIIDTWKIKLSLLQKLFILFNKNPNWLKIENYEKWQINTKIVE